MSAAALDQWLAATNPANRAAEAKAFWSAFGREDEAALANAVREYLGNPDRRGRPTIADLGRTLSRLRASTAAQDQDGADERLVNGGAPERMGFRREPESITRGASMREIANWLREYGDLLADRCLWAHDRPTADPMIARMRLRRRVLEQSLAAAGWVRVRCCVAEWRERRDADRRRPGPPVAERIDPEAAAERAAIATEGLEP